MAWLWSSWEEFVDFVHPSVLDSPGVFKLAEQGSRFEAE